MIDVVSIIIPIFNAEIYLEKCLKSIINQTYRNIEIICINDGSNDNSINILNKYRNVDNRIVIIDKNNAGVSSARNDGIKYSKGNYIMFVDADDYIENDYVKIMLEDIKKYDVNIVRCNYNTCYKNKRQKSKDKEFLGENKKIEGNIILDNIISGKVNAFSYLLLINKKIINNVEFDKKIGLMEDVIFYLEIINNENVFIEGKALYNVQLSPNSITRNKNKNNIIKNIDYILLFNKTFIEKIKVLNFYKLDREKNINSSNINFMLELLISFVSNNSVSNSISLEKKIVLDYNDIFNICNNDEIKSYKKKMVRLLKNNNIYIAYIYIKIIAILKNIRRRNAFNKHN